jgi:hypothetical protein
VELPTVGDHEPAAEHELAELHETASSDEHPLPQETATGWTDQFLPFQVSLRALNLKPPLSPTARQCEAEVHETPRSLAPLADGVVVGTIDHFCPFQASASASVV